MKKIIVLLLIVASISFAKQFGVSLGTGTFAGTDDYAPKHLIGHYYMGLNEKFILGFSAGFGMVKYNEEINYDPGSVRDDYENSVSINGISIEAEFLYFQAIPNTSIKPYIGAGLGVYSYKRNEDNEENDFEAEGNTFGFGQFITFGLDMDISKKLSMFVQFRKLGFSMLKTVDEIDDGNDHEITTDYLAQPGINDLGITAGVKFNF